MSSPVAITLELACGRTLLVDLGSSPPPLHRHNAMTEYGEIYPWLVAARRFGVRGASVSVSPDDEPPLFYLVRCAAPDGWVQVDPATAERQLYGATP